MIHSKVLVSAFLGTLVYAVLVLYGGQNGIKSYNDLYEQKKIVARATTKMEFLNNDLTLESKALQKDKEVIAAYARQLGYVFPGEKLVRINGLSQYQSSLYDVGTVQKHSEGTYLSEQFCKFIGFSFFTVSLIVMLAISFARGELVFGKKDKKIVQGIPVYDLPQI